jgi:hypothetical protein
VKLGDQQKIQNVLDPGGLGRLKQLWFWAWGELLLKREFAIGI